MAVAFASQNYTSFAISTTVVITKPTGLAVGDLMIAQIVYGYNNSLTLSSGFTLLQAVSAYVFSSNNSRMQIAYKFATASDVAAANFTFTQSNTGGIAGGILRFTGASIPQPIYSSSSVSDWNTGAFLPSINTLANSILCMCLNTNNNTNVSAEAIATSNPSWTEAWDDANTFSNALAYSAVRSVGTATGAGTCTFASLDHAGGVLLSIPPDKTFSQLDTISLVEKLSQSWSFTIKELLSISDSFTKTIKKWFNQAKNLATWTNQTKD